MNKSIGFENFRFEIFQASSTANSINMVNLIILDCEDKSYFVSEENENYMYNICGVTYDPKTDSTYYAWNKVDGFTVTGKSVFVTKILPHTTLSLISYYYRDRNGALFCYHYRLSENISLFGQVNSLK